ncbi:unnamed protein product, partial [marine sediment metagenome]
MADTIPKKEEWKPNILVIGPGGIKGFYYCGALLSLDSGGILSDVDTIVGCSVGSLIGLLLISG